MKIIKTLIAIVCIFIFSGFTIWGTTDTPMPRSDNYTVATASISSSGNTIKAIGTITGKEGKTTKTSIQLYLQQYQNNSWTTYAEWSSSGNTVSRTLSKTKTSTIGYKYRVKAICTAHTDSNKETVTKYSTTIIL